MPKSDTFLVDAVSGKNKFKPSRGLTYVDGFRFGFGFFIAGLLILVVVGGITAGIVYTLRLY